MDYDVDAVSVAQFDVDRNGKLLLWSNYANTSTPEAFNASIQLPFPTGLETNFKTFESETAKDNLLLEKIITDDITSSAFDNSLAENNIQVETISSDVYSDAQQEEVERALQIYDEIPWFYQIKNADAVVVLHEDTDNYNIYNRFAQFHNKPIIFTPSGELLREFLIENRVKNLVVIGSNNTVIDLMFEGKENSIKTQEDFEEIALNLMSLYLQKYNTLLTYKDIVEEFATPEHIKLIAQFLDDVNKNGLYTLTDSLMDLLNTNLEQLNFFKKLVDEHNLYFEGRKDEKTGKYKGRMSRTKVDSIAKNYVMSGMLKVSLDPINLIQAMSSVDAMTGPLKKIGNAQPSAMIARTRTPGNVFNKPESILENLVGKDAIGICATGLKAFFGLTAYYNKVLNSGTPEQRKRLVLDTNGIEITLADNKTVVAKHLLANVKNEISAEVTKELQESLDRIGYSDDISLLEDLRSVTDDNKTACLLYSLVKADNDTDAALLLSAMLSLSTDNAKELMLSKLNATTKTIGMYLYGISLGLKFEDIAGIMTSNVARTLTDVMDGNMFTLQRELRSLDQAIGYFEEGPLSLFFGSDSDNGSYLANKLKNYFFPTRKVRAQGRHLLAKLAWRNDTTLEQKLNLLESWKVNPNAKKWTNDYGEVALDKQRSLSFNRLINNAKRYVTQIDSIKRLYHVYESIKTFAEGAQEMRTAGMIFSLNQGLKTKPIEVISQVNMISNIINNRLRQLDSNKHRENLFEWYASDSPSNSPKKEYSPDYMIDIRLLSTKKSMRAKYINDYDRVKHSFNVIDAVCVDEHFDGYLQTLSELFAGLYTTSLKFRTMYDVGNEVCKLLGIYTNSDRENVYQGLTNLYNDYVRDMYFRDRLINLPVNPKTKLFTLGDRIASIGKIKLGTADGNANFKFLMENRIIPALKRAALTKNNLFIKHLAPGVLTNTVSQNALVYQTLPINFMPKKKSEIDIFNMYKNEFNNLSDLDLSIIPEYSNWTVNGHNIPLRDLFYYYGLIAHQGKVGQQSIMTLFENYHTQGAIADFHKFEANFTENGRIKLGDDILLSDIIPYIAKRESPWSATSKYIYAIPLDALLYVLHERAYTRYGYRYFPVANARLNQEALSFYPSGNTRSLISKLFEFDTQIPNNKFRSLFSVELTEGKITKLEWRNYDNLVIDENGNKSYELGEKVYSNKSEESGKFKRLFELEFNEDDTYFNIKGLVLTAIEKEFNC